MFSGSFELSSVAIAFTIAISSDALCLEKKGSNTAYDLIYFSLADALDASHTPRSCAALGFGFIRLCR